MQYSQTIQISATIFRVAPTETQQVDSIGKYHNQDLCRERPSSGPPYKYHCPSLLLAGTFFPIHY